jgi:chromosome segregation ATPase
MSTDLPENEATVATNSAPDPGSSDRNKSSSAGGFLKRLFLAFVKIALALLFIAVLAFGAWLLYIEINRSFDSVITRIERNTRRIEEKEAEIDTLEEQNYAQQLQVAELEATLATREAEINALEGELSANLDQQGERLTNLETDAAMLTGRADALDGEAAILGAGLVALQEDLNNNGQQIDQLGGAVDGLSDALAALDGRTAELQGQVAQLASEDLAGWRQAVGLFRAWEMIGRARLRLLEGNAGLAAADIELAVTAIDDLLTAEPEQSADDLVAIRERLLLASTSLPDEPLVAGRDLETAWEALDAVMAVAIGSGEPAVASE